MYTMIKDVEAMLGPNERGITPVLFKAELAFAVAYSAMNGYEIKDSPEYGCILSPFKLKRDEDDDRHISAGAGLLYFLCRETIKSNPEDGSIKDIKSGTNLINFSDFVFGFCRGHYASNPNMNNQKIIKDHEIAIGTRFHQALYDDINKATEEFKDKGYCDGTEETIPVPIKDSEGNVGMDSQGHLLCFSNYSRLLEKYPTIIDEDQLKNAYVRYKVDTSVIDVKRICEIFTTTGLLKSDFTNDRKGIKIWCEHSDASLFFGMETIEVILIGETGREMNLEYLSTKTIERIIGNRKIIYSCTAVHPEMNTSIFLRNLSTKSIVILGRTDIIEYEEWVERCAQYGLKNTFTHIHNNNKEDLQQKRITFENLEQMQEKLTKYLSKELKNELDRGI